VEAERSVAAPKGVDQIRVGQQGIGGVDDVADLFEERSESDPLARERQRYAFPIVEHRVDADLGSVYVLLDQHRHLEHRHPGVGHGGGGVVGGDHLVRVLGQLDPHAACEPPRFEHHGVANLFGGGQGFVQVVHPDGDRLWHTRLFQRDPGGVLVSTGRDDFRGIPR
jgi:hypothetical protein